jgi:hypothetical protein
VSGNSNQERNDGTIDARSRHITDARGRSVTPLDPVAAYLLRPLTVHLSNRPEVIPVQSLRKVAEELDRYWTRRGYLIFAVYVVGLLLCYAGSLYYRAFISTNPSWDMVGILFWIVQFVFMFGVFYITWRIGKRARLPRTLPVMLKHLRCPHCGYDIRSLPPDPNDGATICPECGCAWMLDDCRAAASNEPPANHPNCVRDDENG